MSVPCPICKRDMHPSSDWWRAEHGPAAYGWSCRTDGCLRGHGWLNDDGSVTTTDTTLDFIHETRRRMQEAAASGNG